MRTCGSEPKAQRAGGSSAARGAEVCARVCARVCAWPRQARCREVESNAEKKREQDFKFFKKNQMPWPRLAFFPSPPHGAAAGAQASMMSSTGAARRCGRERRRLA